MSSQQLCHFCRLLYDLEAFPEPMLNGCKSCIELYHQLQKERGISFAVEERKAETLFKKEFTILDIIAVKDAERFHLGGYSKDTEGFFERRMTFLQTDGKYVIFYGKMPSPLEFLDWMKESGYNFGEGYDVSIERCNNYWEFTGNLDKVASVFHYRIFSESYLQQVLDIIQEPYYTNYSLRLCNLDLQHWKLFYDSTEMFEGLKLSSNGFEEEVDLSPDSNALMLTSNFTEVSFGYWIERVSKFEYILCDAWFFVRDDGPQNKETKTIPCSDYVWFKENLEAVFERYLLECVS